MRAALPPGNPIDSPRGGRVRTATDGRDILLNTPDGWEIDSPALWWLGPAGSDGTGGPFGNPPPGAGDPTLLTGLSAVTRCTSIIVDAITDMPWMVIRGRYEELPIPAWIADPQVLRMDGRVVDPASLWDVRLSAVEFWAQWIQAALWYGDGYVYVPTRDESGAPKPPLWQLNPHSVKIEDGTYWVEETPLPSSSIIHLRGRPPYWNGHGRGVLTDHSLDLVLAATVRAYASGVYSTGVPAGYLKSSQPNMTADQAQSLKATWLAQHGGIKRSIAVLNATTEFHPISINPVDAQLDTSRTWATLEIANAFGVPPSMLGVSKDSQTYASLEMRNTDLRTFTLLPWMRRIESTLDAQLPKGTSVKLKADGLLRPDTKGRTESYASALASGWLTVDEVRELEDRPPLSNEGVL